MSMANSFCAGSSVVTVMQAENSEVLLLESVAVAAIKLPGATVTGRKAAKRAEQALSVVTIMSPR
jgi:hypothetical protein